jgi:hypothetical protein
MTLVRGLHGRFEQGEGESLPHGKTVYSQRLREDVLTLRKRGLVPLAIADILDIADSTVANHLRALGITVPRYLSLEGPERELHVCPNCGHVEG